MKVFAITSFSNSNFNKKIYNKKPQNTEISEVNSFDMLSFMEKTARTNISFGSKDFGGTLEANYFKLPKGARADVFQKAAAQILLRIF
jgi:hypothetical protein